MEKRRYYSHPFSSKNSLYDENQEHCLTRITSQALPVHLFWRGCLLALKQDHNSATYFGFLINKPKLTEPQKFKISVERSHGHNEWWRASSDFWPYVVTGDTPVLALDKMLKTVAKSEGNKILECAPEIRKFAASVLKREL